MTTALSLRSDVVVVGSGPGGATVARQLAQAGKRVLLLERGIDQRPRAYYGTYLGALIYADRRSLLFTQEGLNIIRPLMVGGATSMYCGCAAPPPGWLKQKYGVDIDTEVAETIEELELAPLPAELRGPASTRLAQAAQALGYDWRPQLKFMRPMRAAKFDCGAKCMLGCRCGAKWSAAEFVDEAVAAGASLQTRARIDRVLREDGHVAGVEGRLNGRSFVARADTVVLAAGGIGTPRILQASGVREAGAGMTMDTTVMVYGFVKERGTGNEPPMTWSWENPEAGYMLSTLIDPWLLYPLITALKGVRYPLSWPRWNHLLGVMIKLKDDVSGGVFADGSISKPLTANDRSRLAQAEKVCRQILIEAGADRDTIFMTPLRGTHPSGTVRIDTLVDRNLQTETQGLYVCDASVFPEALARPTVLTIIGLAKRLAKQLEAMMTLDALQAKLDAYPRLPLAQYPTPLQFLPRLSRELDRPIYLKRDDELGPALGGNKTRKLEYLIADAQQRHARKVVTFGGLQSNHARLTAAVARQYQLEPHLFYFERRPAQMSGNLLINQLLGARLHFIPFGGGDASMTLEQTIRLVRLLAWLRVGAHYYIPVGGHNWRGCLGYVRAAAEIDEQVRAAGIENAWLVVAAGSGGTLAGLLAGLALLDSPLHLLGIDVGKLWKSFPVSIARLASEVCSQLGTPRTFTPDQVPLIEGTYVGERYAVLSQACIDAVRRLAQCEGILLDPVYTGKAFAGLLDLLQRGQLGSHAPIIFLHTGGVPALFAYDQQVLKASALEG